MNDSTEMEDTTPEVAEGTDSAPGNQGDVLVVDGPAVDRGRIGPVALGVRLCGAKTRAGGTCNSPAVTGSARCRMHGGKSLVGPSHPGFRHGRYSKHLPTNLRQTYDAAVEDDDLLSLRDELALLKTRLVELSGRLQSGESATLWNDLRLTHDVIVQAITDNDTPKVSNGLIRLGEIIRKGNQNEETWEVIQETMKGVAQVNQAEWKRLADLRQFITAERAMALVMTVVQSVQRHVKDVRVLSDIQREVSAMLRASLPGGGDGDGLQEDG